MTARRSRKASGPQPRVTRLDVARLNARLAESGREWTAAESPLSRLSAEEQRGHLGLAADPEELRLTSRMIVDANQITAVRMRSAMAISAPPAAIDWRNHGGNYVTPVRDQASCGSCVSFGTLGAIEARANIACKTPGQNRDYAEAFLFYCGCGNCCNTGWNFPPALDYCKNTGVAAETSFPYVPGNRPCPPNIPVVFKIAGWSSLLSVQDRKTAIADRGPVIAGMAVYQDFFSYKSGVYAHTTGGLAGYHCVCVVGYDDASRCWICKNSWGAGWGDAGFFRIRYGDSGIDTQFAFYEPQVPCPTPPGADCARYVPALRRVIVAARANARLRACLRYHVCHQGRRPRCTGQDLVVVRVVLAILARCPKYRVPFCRAIL